MPGSGRCEVTIYGVRNCPHPNDMSKTLPDQDYSVKYLNEGITDNNWNMRSFFGCKVNPNEMVKSWPVRISS